MPNGNLKNWTKNANQKPCSCSFVSGFTVISYNMQTGERDGTTNGTEKCYHQQQARSKAKKKKEWRSLMRWFCFSFSSFRMVSTVKVATRNIFSCSNFKVVSPEKEERKKNKEDEKK